MISADLDGEGEALSVFQELVRIAPEVAARQVDITGLNIESKAKNLCVVGVAGLLRASIHYKRTGEAEGVVEVNQAYAPYVEYGTPPHMPPVEALELWADRILGDPSLAWAVAMSIKERGTPSQPFLFPAAEEERPKHLERMKEAIERLK
jgi:hypothetical protein